VPEDYVHRIGRTGRAGAEGSALSLVCAEEGKLLGDIQKLLGREIQREIAPGFEGEELDLRKGTGPAQGQRGQRPPRREAGNGGNGRSRAQSSGSGNGRSSSRGQPRGEVNGNRAPQQAEAGRADAGQARRRRSRRRSAGNSAKAA
jgi:ATP-dependent RNA helicase RhlE